jgi:hypothetical protein
MTRVIRLGALLALVSLTAAAPAAAQGAKARFTLTGGPQAGSYEMTAMAACGAFDSGSKDDGFGARFVADAPRGWHKGPPYLSQMVLSIPRMRNPKPDELALAVVFTKWGTPETEIKYEVFTIPRELDIHPELAHKPTGRGEAKVQRSAGGLSATFRGETADGVRIEGSLQCAP